MKFKKYYLLLIVLMFLYLAGFTYLNLFVYGSVIDSNVPILSLTLIIPLYLAFKQKSFSKKMIITLYVFLLSVGLFSFVVLPKYTYDEAVEMIPDTYVETLRRHVGEEGFIYKGNYYIKTTNGAYSFDIKDGTYKGVEDDFK